MADITRPKTKLEAGAEPKGVPAVNGFAVTPVEGLEERAVPKVPVDPNDVLQLLKARLALGSPDAAKLDAFAGPSSYQTTQEQPTSWPPKDKSPSSPDITPSPVVIGVSELEALGISDEHSDEDQRNTPAEPVASVRVRQASQPPVSEASGEPSDPWNFRHGVVAESLYFPPMKPPESWRSDHADEPLVQVVPECDSKVRTAKSLRRNSNWPTPSYLSDLRKRPSILLVSGVSVLALLGLALVIAPLNRTSTGSPLKNVVDRRPLAAPVAAPIPSIDAGTVRNEPAASSVPTPLSSAATNPVPQTRNRGASEKAREPQPAPKPVPHSSDGLVF